MAGSSLDAMPSEILLRIFIYLDLPDLSTLCRTSRRIRNVVSDRALHRVRLLVVAPSRVQFSLFGEGGTLRPTVGDLIHRGFMRGLGIERRWRHGLYFYSPQSVVQYETSMQLQKTHLRHLLSSHINARPMNALQLLHSTRILPDVESSSPRISRTLLPVVRKLKWCIQKDRLAKQVREQGGLKDWLEDRGRLLVRETERVRLAICPGVRKVVGFWEELSARAP